MNLSYPAPPTVVRELLIGNSSRVTKDGKPVKASGMAGKQPRDSLALDAAGVDGLRGQLSLREGNDGEGKGEDLFSCETL